MDFGYTPRPRGEVAEWSNVPDSKSGVGASLPWVRIPPSPPEDLKLRPFRGVFYLCMPFSMPFSSRLVLVPPSMPELPRWRRLSITP